MQLQLQLPQRSKSNQPTAQTSSEDLLLCILDEIEHFLQGNNMTELPLRSIRQFALNIFVELRAEAVTAVMPALANFIFQSRQRAGIYMVSSLCVFLVSFADTVSNTVTYELRIQ